MKGFIFPHNLGAKLRKCFRVHKIKLFSFQLKARRSLCCALCSGRDADVRQTLASCGAAPLPSSLWLVDKSLHLNLSFETIELMLWKRVMMPEREMNSGARLKDPQFISGEAEIENVWEARKEHWHDDGRAPSTKWNENRNLCSAIWNHQENEHPSTVCLRNEIFSIFAREVPYKISLPFSLELIN